MTGDALEERDPAVSPEQDASADTDDDSAPALSPCPRCGDPMVLVTVRGPGDRRVSPCGCRL
ncbi:hypothetical protein [Natronobiforma cellulositropha]|uniref:hypothetical protein n=1 Tax=Natronobiforma cellulositropha TaxID=1679076 RepID=UPI0021D5BAB9|nr:hypothetical protein [Natronobiforma cellulositropha]